MNVRYRESAPVGQGLSQLAWGFYQELVYRGALQTELTRRMGGLWGALAANVAFTFGPLHFYHLTEENSPVSKAIMFMAVFAIGAVFAFIFHRTRNLWLVGVLHGIGNAFMNSPAQFAVQFP